MSKHVIEGYVSPYCEASELIEQTPSSRMYAFTWVLFSELYPEFAEKKIRITIEEID